MKDMAASPQAPHLINLFRVLSLAGVFFMSNLPSVRTLPPIQPSHNLIPHSLDKPS